MKQHQLIARLLKDEIAQWHGFTLKVRDHKGTPCLGMPVLPCACAKVGDGLMLLQTQAP